MVVDPLDLTEETDRILSGYLRRWLRNGRLIPRDKALFLNFKYFILTNDLLIREKVPGIWHVDVMAREGSTQTRCGFFCPVLAVIHVTDDEVAPLTIKIKNKRLIHVQNKDGWHEFNLMQRCSHLSARGLFAYIPSMISIRRPRGDILLQVLNRDRKNPSIAINDRYRMTISFLRALRNQIHQAGLCHKGLKPDTIYFDNESGEFTFVEFDISQLNDDKSDLRSRGNVVFSPPEEFTSVRTNKPVTDREYSAMVGMKSMTNKKYDVYSAARVIGLIWRDLDTLFTDKYIASELMKKRIRSAFVPQFNLFHQLGDLTADEKFNIEKLLRDMTNPIPGERPALDECIERFLNVYLHRLLRSVPSALQDAVKVSHELAINLDRRLEACNDRVGITTCFTEVVNQLPDNDYALNHFIEILNIGCLKTSMSKSELVSKVEGVFALFDCYQKSLLDWQVRYVERGNIVQGRDVARLLASLNAQPFSIDGVAREVEHMHQKLMKLENADITETKAQKKELIHG